MRVRTAVLGLLLVVHFAHAHRTNNDYRHLSREVRYRRHDHEERTSGRRWTTSRNSPYQKVVSRYDQEGDLRTGSSERLESETPEEPKAKSVKRKQWRTDASSHDQIPSETASAGENDKDEHESESSEQSELQASEAPRKSSGSSRRRSTTIHPREPTSTDGYLEVSTSNPKKRRRIQTTSTSTSTLAPQTMSDSLYQHFHPLDHNVPQDDIIPFLDFGRKLSPVLPTPSGANSIDNRSTATTRTRLRTHHEERDSNSSDEEMLQEDMDVTVVKKAIERNSVPRAKLRVREQGISDYYRKRVPVHVRTTENLISTSDSSTVSTVSATKNNGVLKKIYRHQINNEQLIKSPEHLTDRLIHSIESHSPPSNVEILEEKVTEILSRHSQKNAALTEESHHSPLTAESSVVKTVIKEIPTTEKSIELPSTTKPTVYVDQNTTPLKNVTESIISSTTTTTTTPEDILIGTPSNKTSNFTEKLNPKILSTAVVTSVSIQESLLKSQTHFVSEPPANITTTEISPIPLNITTDDFSTVHSDLKISTEVPTRNFIPNKNSTNVSTTTVPPLVATNASSIETKTILLRNETSLRSRDIYKPKAIPPGINIHHLPRQIPFNITRKTNSSSSSTSSSVTNTTSNSITNTSSTTVGFRTTVKVPTSSISTSPSTVQKAKSTQWRPTTPLPKVHAVPASTSQVMFSNVTERALNGKSSGTSTTTSSTSQSLPAENIPSDDQESNKTVHLQQSGFNSNSSHESPGEEEEVPLLPEEAESIPPPKYEDSVENLTFVPAPSEEETEDQFPIYFTTLPTATPPVVDTRPKPGAPVVKQPKNLTTLRPGADWVRVGAVDKEVEVVYPEPLGIGAYLLAGLGVVPIILGALIGARFILAHNKKKVLDESEYSSEYNRSPLGTSTASPLPTKLPRINTHLSWNETEKTAPTIAPVPVTSSVARWEFSRDKMRLQTLLGQGNFGQVWKAEADDIAGHEGLTRLVAVKTVKESANAREREDLLRELGIMQELGSHPNVVTLLGCCTEKEPIYLIMEYVMYGKLLSFLRDHRTRAHYYNFSDATDALTSRDLTVFAYCVARGMDYLTNKSIIHRDLAARNVLVDHNKLCKIADFGMSRNVRDTGQIYEQRQSKGALPIRWMAPESLHFSLFTHKTDVWSFGILMWEIVTLGSTPYATMGAREVMRRVGDGYRLERPTHCRPELFRVISQCWHSEPSRRPTFAELKVELGHLLNDSERGGGFVDLESFADEMRRDSLHRHH